MTWRERLKKWNEIIEKEKFSEKVDSMNSRYGIEFDMKEVENSLRKDVVEKSTETRGTRALWIEKRWWLYRPKLPYTYFLQKLDSSEVILKRLSGVLTLKNFVNVFTSDLTGRCSCFHRGSKESIRYNERRFSVRIYCKRILNFIAPFRVLDFTDLISFLLG